MQYTTQQDLTNKIAALANGERIEVSGVPEEVYHASKGIGSTLMRAAMVSMAHYKVELEREREVSAEMILGSALHKLVLEPEDFDSLIVEIPPEYKTNVSQKFKEWAKPHDGKLLLRKEELEQINEMAEAILLQVPEYFRGGDPEKSYWYRDEKTGLMLKARIDYQIGDAAIDLKTTRKETASTFNNSVKYDYHAQDSLYRKVTGLADMVFVGISKAKPYQCFLSIHSDDCRAKNDKQLGGTLAAIALSDELKSYHHAPVELMETRLNSWEK